MVSFRKIRFMKCLDDCGVNMATFVKYQGYQMPEEFTEPCMNCFASVAYKRNEPRQSKNVIGHSSIVCPYCGKEMFVNYCNSILC